MPAVKQVQSMASRECKQLQRITIVILDPQLAQVDHWWARDMQSDVAVRKCSIMTGSKRSIQGGDTASRGLLDGQPPAETVRLSSRPISRPAGFIKKMCCSTMW